MSWINPVKKRLSEGFPVIGATLTTPGIEIAARVAGLGFDFLWVEMEHSPITLETLRTIVLATRGLPALPFARVPINEFWTAKRVLDQGVAGVMFPFTSTPELAQQAVAACRYPPLGRRGSGAGLTTFTWPGDAEYYDCADRNVLVVAIVEEARALDRIDEIAATDGVDVIFVGTSDLSFSLDLRGQQDHPLLQEAIEKVVAACKRYGKFAGRPAASAEAVACFQEQGFQFFQGPTEIGLLTRGAKNLLEPLRGSSAGTSESKSLY
ncbi:MAG: aldolase/citrate lyase family protein [Acidobacteriota bacterium]